MGTTHHAYDQLELPNNRKGQKPNKQDIKIIRYKGDNHVSMFEGMQYIMSMDNIGMVEIKVLIDMALHCKLDENTISYGTPDKERVEKLYGYTSGSVNRAVKNLENCWVIKRIKRGDYIISPHVFFRGHFMKRPVCIKKYDSIKSSKYEKKEGSK